MYYTKKAKVFFVVLLCLASLFNTYGEVKSLVVEQIDLEKQTKLVFALDQTPTYWVEGSTLSISSSSLESKIPLSSVSKIYFSEEVLTSSPDHDMTHSFSFAPNPALDEIYVYGVNGLSLPVLSTESGVLLNVPTVTNGDVVYMNVSSLQTGNYVLLINNQSYKLIKK